MLLDFPNLITQIKNAIVALSKETFKSMAAAAASDGTSLLHTIQSNLEKYTNQLQCGEIDEEEFRILVLGNHDLINMTALTEAGLAAAQADAFKLQVFKTIIDTVIELI